MYWPMLNLHLLLRTRPFRITLWIIPKKKHFGAMTKRGVTERLPHVCDPSSPWQKDTVENTNRRLRRWLPRKRDIRQYTDHDMKVIRDRLNNTPRKCLGWKTPAEVFHDKILEERR